ncbi:MAG: 50S ribosomal protein L4 [Acidobacteriota bacterium]|nr:50S ribosomal protein L4 [Acidobacteriota bacterium]
MAEVEIRNLQNKVVGKLELAEEIFNYTARGTLVWEAVRAYQAAQRKGTHATKTRAAVRGGGRKPWKQKGTGRARVGSIRSPLWKKGGVVFGPQPRDYRQSFPKKKRRGALKLVLSEKLRNQSLTVVDEFELESHRTREFLGVLENFELAKKLLVVDALENRNLYLSARNLPEVKSVPLIGLNVYDLVNCQHVLISKKAILELQEVLQNDS